MTPLQQLCFGENDVTAWVQTVIFLRESRAEPLSSEGRISIVSSPQPCNLPPMKP